MPFRIVVCRFHADPRPGNETPAKRIAENPYGVRVSGVGATGIEPVTSAVSRQRSAAELSARCGHCIPTRRRRESNPGTGFCRPLPHHSATSPRPLSTKSGRNRPPSGRPDSNRRPQPWQGCALPAELRPRWRGCYHGAARTDYEPVDPNPPDPRLVAGSSSTTSKSWTATGTTTSCAIRLPRSITNASLDRLTRTTLISPR